MKRKMIYIILTLVLTVISISQASNKKLEISKEELSKIAERIFQNEAGGKKDNLVYWNKGENLPSLGIGHFIWYKEGEPDRFEESFPKLVEFYKTNKIELPTILKDNKYAPWIDRDQLFSEKQNKDKDVTELTEFLNKTKDTQILFIFERLKSSLEKMKEKSTNKENLEYQFYRVANSPNGLYALIDYVNFKGEGINDSETYNKKGWGLRQVLENMTGKEIGNTALTEFSNSAKSVLEQRVKNSDPKRNELKWLLGWKNRCETYKNKK